MTAMKKTHKNSKHHKCRAFCLRQGAAEQTIQTIVKQICKNCGKFLRISPHISFSTCDIVTKVLNVIQGL